MGNRYSTKQKQRFHLPGKAVWCRLSNHNFRPRPEVCEVALGKMRRPHGIGRPSPSGVSRLTCPRGLGGAPRGLTTDPSATLGLELGAMDAFTRFTNQTQGRDRLLRLVCCSYLHLFPDPHSDPFSPHPGEKGVASGRKPEGGCRRTEGV